MFIYINFPGTEHQILNTKYFHEQITIITICHIARVEHNITVDTDHKKPKAVIICGATGIGKTGFAIELAKKFKGEIIGADSMQVYRHMDIGTAKPTPKERSMVAHHMVDVVDPGESFDAETYAAMAFQKVLDLTDRDTIPFVVGGTGLYIKSLVFGLFDADPADPVIRNRLKEEAELKGSLFLHQKLGNCDPETAAKLHVNDTYRIIRALEIYEVTGIPISEYHRHHRFKSHRLDTLSFCLQMDRDRLYERIDARVDEMIQAGLLDEVKQLLDAGYSSALKSMQSIGYRHMVEFLTGHMAWEEAVRTLKRDTRRYAKRQMTWFRADPEIIWVASEPSEDIENRISNFLF
jgi:tRNA dimethylallyltransferase